MNNTETNYTTIEIGSLDVLVKELLLLRANGSWSFRGQRNNDWSLALHHIESKQQDKYVDVFLKQFRKRCIEFRKTEYTERLDNDPWQWMFYAQHHKLKHDC